MIKEFSVSRVSQLKVDNNDVASTIREEHQQVTAEEVVEEASRGSVLDLRLYPANSFHVSTKVDELSSYKVTADLAMIKNSFISIIEKIKEMKKNKNTNNNIKITSPPKSIESLKLFIRNTTYSSSLKLIIYTFVKQLYFKIVIFSQLFIVKIIANQLPPPQPSPIYITFQP
jgi:hypothetical protein